jgi:hypothetical protein
MKLAQDALAFDTNTLRGPDFRRVVKILNCCGWYPRTKITGRGSRITVYSPVRWPWVVSTNASVEHDEDWVSNQVDATFKPMPRSHGYDSVFGSNENLPVDDSLFGTVSLDDGMGPTGP